jgi:hypothetical protein
MNLLDRFHQPDQSFQRVLRGTHRLSQNRPTGPTSLALLSQVCPQYPLLVRTEEWSHIFMIPDEFPCDFKEIQALKKISPYLWGKPCSLFFKERSQKQIDYFMQFSLTQNQNGLN